MNTALQWYSCELLVISIKKIMSVRTQFLLLKCSKLFTEILGCNSVVLENKSLHVLSKGAVSDYLSSVLL